MNATPKKIDSQILEFCQKIAINSEPVYLKIEPAKNAIPLDCYNNVARQVVAQGGSTVYGWRIWNALEFYLEAEFHAVWRDLDGKLCDISPKETSDSRILFLPDYVRNYEGKQIKSVRLPLSDDPTLRVLLKTFDDEFELKNRGDRSTAIGITLSLQEMSKLEEIESRKAKAFELLTRPITITRSPEKQKPNELCWCNSGKKYKKCHGRNELLA